VHIAVWHSSFAKLQALTHEVQGELSFHCRHVRVHEAGRLIFINYRHICMHAGEKVQRGGTGASGEGGAKVTGLLSFAVVH